LPAQGAGPSLSLLPYLDYLLDESGTLDIEEAAAPDRAQAYAPLALEKLPRAEGVMWLRFTLAPLAPGERPATLLLDMGESIPGTPMLYEPERNDLSGALEWRESSPAQRNVLLLPEAGAEPVTCYIRLDGLPGLWFSPMVRTPADAATNWGSLARTGAILALGVVMLLCLLRGLSENGQWRVWTALYVAVALAQALLGMPEGGVHRPGLGQAAATLAPGIALMLLPHVGRHLMRTRERARGLDIQLLLLSLPGAVLALLPLVPGWAWLDRWLDLWPAATLLFVPTALGAWLMGLGGARRFLLGCLLPPLFVAAGVLGLDFGIPPNLLASAPLWGVALSALLIAATGAPADMAAETAAPRKRAGKAEAQGPDEGGIIDLDHPLDDPNLRLVQGAKAATPAAPGAPTQDDVPPAGAPRAAGSAERARAEAREGARRAPLDDLLREGAALEQCALPPAVRQYA
ncbi:MAG: response regulator, partial [Desulfovibrio sp.]|nr:response regulator [Desulfovibrio sp.]